MGELGNLKTQGNRATDTLFASAGFMKYTGRTIGRTYFFGSNGKASDMRTATTRWLVSLVFLFPATMASAAELKLTFPQNRTTFQTNERIDVSVVRTGEGELPAGHLTLVLAGEKSTMTFVFDLKAGSGSATDQAVGTLFEIAAGLDSLFPLAIPRSATVEMAK